MAICFLRGCCRRHADHCVPTTRQSNSRRGPYPGSRPLNLDRLLVPRDVDGLLVAGRHISCDPSSHSFLREIPQCWLTGQAAGVAAALAAAKRCAPRAVPIAELQALLRRQEVLLRAEVEPALAPAVETPEAEARHGR